jgi:hypothetical protein
VPAPAAPAKRKRTEEPVASTASPAVEPVAKTNGNGATPVQPVVFRHFVPRPWVEVRRDSAVSTSWVAADSIQEEAESDAKLVPEGSAGAAELQTRVDTIIKTRRSENGEGKIQFERQTITRTLDVYIWDSNAVGSAEGEDVKMANAGANGLSGQEDAMSDTSLVVDISMCAPDARILKSSTPVDSAPAQADMSM